MDENSVGIYNTLHDSAVVIDKEIMGKLYDKEEIIDDEILNSLLNNKIIFSDTFNEKQYFRFYLNKMKYSPLHATFIISLTSDCNLCCEYCFEGKKKAAIKMTPKVASKAIQFIADSFKKNTSLRYLYIAFFGGEPLLNRKIMRLMCNEISRNSHLANAVKYILTSNLTLLTDDDIELMRQFQFMNVQVALDGAQAVHDRRRKFNSGAGSFDIIIKNIRKLIGNDIKVMVILNFDKENEESYDDLIHFVKQQLPYRQIEFILNPITKSLCNNNCDINFMTRDQESKTFLNIYNKLKKNGLTVRAFGHSDMLCILTTDISCIISPEGSIYKCSMMLGNPKYSVGNIFSDLKFSFNYEIISEEPWETCLEAGCAYLPICGAGCRSLALINEGNLKSVYCQKENYFDSVYKVVLKDHFNQLLEGGT